VTDDEERAMWQEALAQRPPTNEPVPAEVVWRAVAGELPEPDRTALIERLAWDADLQEAWRLALTMQREEREAPPARRPWIAAVVALAAALLLVVGLWSGRPTEVPVYRGDPAVSTPLADRAPLPRQDFTLRWSHPPGARARLDVWDADLQVLGRADDLSTGSFTVPPAWLAPVADGDEVVWRVTLVDDGRTTTSPAFVQRVVQER
jgi:hypothetical protein